MQNCNQSKNQTIWEHCQSVLGYYKKLLVIFPEKFEKYRDFLLSNQLDLETVTEYISWHDCGKPFCQKENHFLDHANKSADIFSQVSTNELVISLIRNDMLFHIIKPSEVSKLQLDATFLSTLALSALAALESNAEMFGGTESESYKIKISNLERRIKALSKKFN